MPPLFITAVCMCITVLRSHITKYIHSVLDTFNLLQFLQIYKLFRISLLTERASVGYSAKTSTVKLAVEIWQSFHMIVSHDQSDPN